DRGEGSEVEDEVPDSDPDARLAVGVVSAGEDRVREVVDVVRASGGGRYPRGRLGDGAGHRYISRSVRSVSGSSMLQLPKDVNQRRTRRAVASSHVDSSREMPSVS